MKPKIGTTKYAQADFYNLNTGAAVIQVTEWPNGDGFNVFISDPKGEPKERNLDFTWCEFNALKNAVREMEKNQAKSSQ